MSLPFVDTNVLLYLGSSPSAKLSRAEQLVSAGGWISVQVLNEAARVLRGKWRAEWDVVQDFLLRCREAFAVAPLDLDTHLVGLAVAERYQIGIFDAMIVASALQCGCELVYSEDMHAGLEIDGRLRIVNPFRT